MSAPHSAASRRQLLSQNNVHPMNGYEGFNGFTRDPSTLSTHNIGFSKVLEKNAEAEDQTLYQVDVVNESLLRTSNRSELASKKKCLTRRWQTLLVSSLVILALAGGIGGLAYWITIPKVITQPFLLYNASCYMNSRSCDATRSLWCPAGICICTGNYQWNATSQNCSCGTYSTWTGFKCQNYGYYGDPCNSVLCQPTLTCESAISQTYTTNQSICVCDNTTYLDTIVGSSTIGTCIPRVSYNAACLTNSDCENWLGLSCNSGTSGLRCQCSSTSYWNGSYCVQNALGWQACSVSIPCDTTRGLTCSNTSNTCQCDQLSYWDNVTSIWCQQLKTYAATCQYTFQCNTTVNLTCPSISSGCNCPTTSYAYKCDCAAGTFWDGQRCVTTHIYNGTCPGQYACASTLVCYLGHCICPGNMAWNNRTANSCDCLTGTTWNSTVNTCA